jgi:hypothetical protein
MPDPHDGRPSRAAQEGGAVDEVARNTKTETTPTSYTTTDHDEIRRWAEARGGRPAIVEGTEQGSDPPGGVLRIDFDESDDTEDRLAETDWETFFEIFEDRRLAFVYQEQTADGKTSRFNKFIRRDSS